MLTSAQSRIGTDATIPTSPHPPAHIAERRCATALRRTQAPPSKSQIPQAWLHRRHAPSSIAVAEPAPAKASSRSPPTAIPAASAPGNASPAGTSRRTQPACRTTAFCQPPVKTDDVRRFRPCPRPGLPFLQRRWTTSSLPSSSSKFTTIPSIASSPPRPTVESMSLLSADPVFDQFPVRRVW